MTKRGIFLGGLLIIALAMIAALWGMQTEANRHLREQAETSRQLLARLTFLEMDNNRLSNIVAQTDTPLAAQQLVELSKLREEVRKLRLRTNDLEVMRSELRRLRTQLSAARGTISSSPPDVPTEDIHPRDSWKFAGFDTPENAVESATFAISQGDQSAYMQSLSPDLRDEMASQLGEGTFADVGPLALSDASAYRILGRDAVSDDMQVITIYVDGEAAETPLVVVKTPEGWKVAGAWEENN